MVKHFNIIKIFIFTSTLILQYLFMSNNVNFIYISLLLILIINHQVRHFSSKSTYKAISLFVDILLIFYLCYNYDFPNCFLFFVSLIDSLSLKDFCIPISTILLFCYIIIGYVFYLGIFIQLTFLMISYILLIYIINCQGKQIDRLNLLNDDIRRYSYELESAKLQIEQYSKQVGELSVIRERNRIAESLHDSIGHRLTSVLYRLQSLQITANENNSLLVGELNSITEHLRNSIVLLRNKVKNVEVKRESSLKESLISLVNKFQAESNILVKLSIDLDLSYLTPNHEAVFYNNIKEALNNILKHSTCNEVYINFSKDNSCFTVTIHDNGECSNEIKFGYGLRSMKNRCDIVNGFFEVDNSNGFKITLKCPIKE